MRLIDADALEQDGWCMNRIVQIDEKTMEYQTRKPTDFPAIEPKKGRWRRRLVDCGFNADWHCSECGWKTSLEKHGYNFCPNCGADMRGDADGCDS